MRHHEKSLQKCDCSQILEEFDEHVKEVDGHVKRAEALKERAKSTAQLVRIALLVGAFLPNIEVAIGFAKLRRRNPAKRCSFANPSGEQVNAIFNCMSSCWKFWLDLLSCFLGAKHKRRGSSQDLDDYQFDISTFHNSCCKMARHLKRATC